MTYYIKGGSRYNEANPTVWCALTLNGFTEAKYLDADWKLITYESIIDTQDPFWLMGSASGGAKEVEIGLYNDRRIKIDTTGIFGWDGAAWQNLIGGGAGGNLGDLDDVVITGTPADNELLAWDNSSSKWINQTAAEAGLAVSGHNHAHNSLTGLNLGDDYEHITQTQKNALHSIYTLEVHNNTYHDPDYKEDFSENTGFNKNFGTLGTEVCVGNDARLSDSRTPLAHVLGTSGPHTDSLPLTDIASYVQGSIIKGGAGDWEALGLGTQNYILKAGATDVAWGQVAWGEVTSKPTEFTPISHNNTYHSTNYHSEADGTGVVTVHSDITSAGSGIIITSGERTGLHTRLHSITDILDHSASNHKIFYSDGSAHIIELALGADGDVLTSTGVDTAPAFETPTVGAHTHDGDTLQLDAITSDGGVFNFGTSGELNLKVSGDSGDYIQVKTVTDLPYLKVIGGYGIYIDSDNSNEIQLCLNRAGVAALSLDLYGLGGTPTSRLLSSIDFYIYPNNSTTYGTKHYVTANVPYIEFQGAQGYIKNVHDPSADQDAATKKYHDDNKYSLEQHNNTYHSTNYHSEADGTGVVTVHSDITNAGSGIIITAGERNNIHAEAHILGTSGPHTGTLPWGDLNKTGSSLADLATRAHSNLSDAPTSAHHVRYADSEAVLSIIDKYYSLTDTLNGRRYLRTPYTNNLLFSSDKRFTVTKTGTTITYSAEGLFDGNLSNYPMTIADGQTVTINIDLIDKGEYTGDGLTYSYGKIYAHDYYTYKCSAVRARLFTKNGDGSHSWRDWVNGVNISTSGSYAIWEINLTGNYHCQELEIEFTASGNDAWISELEWNINRDLDYRVFPLLNKSLTNNVYGNLVFKDSSNVTQLTITSAGLVDGQDVSAMATDLANQCTTAEAHTYVEATALTLTQNLTLADGIELLVEDEIKIYDTDGDADSLVSLYMSKAQNGMRLWTQVDGSYVAIPLYLYNTNTYEPALFDNFPDAITFEGNLTVPNLICAGNVDGVDVSAFNTTMRAQGEAFPGNGNEGDLFYSRADDSYYRWNDEALAWIEIGVGGGRGSLNLIDEIVDVVITGTPANNELLAYDTGTSKWINQTAGEAGLATTAEVPDYIWVQAKIWCSVSGQDYGEAVVLNAVGETVNWSCKIPPDANTGADVEVYITFKETSADTLISGTKHLGACKDDGSELQSWINIYNDIASGLQHSATANRLVTNNTISYPNASIEAGDVLFGKWELGEASRTVYIYTITLRFTV